VATDKTLQPSAVRLRGQHDDITTKRVMYDVCRENQSSTQQQEESGLHGEEPNPLRECEM
jgi:hypothetical protein